MTTNKLSHVDEDGFPRMVDVSDKIVSQRIASAQAEVVFPLAVAVQLQRESMRTSKGSIIDTAIIAGTMAAKQTANLIPFCHPLALSSIRIELAWISEHRLRVLATVKCEAKTGVEMEALTATSIAALSVYDMTKALSHEIEISAIRLLTKSGGKADFNSSIDPSR